MKLFGSSSNKDRHRQKVRSEQLQAIWRRVANQTSSRLGSSGVVSVVMHAVIITGYVFLSTLYQPEVLEIREITFIDLTDDTQISIPSQKEVGIGSQVASPRPKTERKEPQTPAPSQPTAKSEIIEQRDAIAVKSAPINLENLASQTADILTPSDIVNDAVSSSPIGDLSEISPSKVVLEEGEGEDRLSIPQPVLAVQPGVDRGAKIKLTGNITVSRNAIEGAGAPITSSTSDGIQNIHASSGRSSASISGPLANRKIVKKAIPSFPLWAKKQGVGATIALRFTVMEDGSVKENIVVERTSGSQEWDHIVIKALRSWQFAPLDKLGVRYDQNGVITFHFVIT